MENEKLEEIRQRVTNPEITLHISRIPRKTKAEFVKWCEEEFESDWGMGLKFLWDYFKGILPIPHSEADQKIEILANEISELKQQKKKVITSINGKVIAEKSEE